MEAPARRPYFVMDPGGTADEITPQLTELAQQYAADFRVSYSAALTRILDWLTLLQGQEALAAAQGTPGSVDVWNDSRGPLWVPIPPGAGPTATPPPVSSVPAAVVSAPPGPMVSTAPSPGGSTAAVYSGAVSVSSLALLVGLVVVVAVFSGGR
jgi:hypothetical protein